MISLTQEAELEAVCAELWNIWVRLRHLRTTTEDLRDDEELKLSIDAVQGACLHLEDGPMRLLDTNKMMRGTALMVPGTKQWNVLGYQVTVQCSRCRHKQRVGFGGWSAIVCGNCGSELERTPYRKVRS